jgi:hypothetical protein
MTMSDQQNHIRVRIDQIERLLMFDYEPGSQEALFDICDSKGHIVKTGEVNGPVTRVRITDLDGEEYYLMVLDGEISTVKPFQLRKAV